MSHYADLSRRLTEALGLHTPPVAIDFGDAGTSGLPGPAGPLAAGCGFWETGSRNAVATSARDHRFCAIGVYTHNLADAPESQASELDDVLKLMQGLDYVSPNEVGALPVLAASPQEVRYRPLAECSETPACVLVFLNAEQSLIAAEAVGRVDGRSPPALGRPACALVPFVVDTGSSAVSLGCCGARAYLDVLDAETSVWGLNGESLDAYVDCIEVFARANATLDAFHRQRRSEVARQQEPTVMETFDHLQGGADA